MKSGAETNRFNLEALEARILLNADVPMVQALLPSVESGRDAIHQAGFCSPESDPATSPLDELFEGMGDSIPVTGETAPATEAEAAEESAESEVAGAAERDVPAVTSATPEFGKQFDSSFGADSVPNVSGLLVEALRSANAPPPTLAFAIPAQVSQVVLRRNGSLLEILDADSSVDLLGALPNFNSFSGFTIVGQDHKDETLILDLSGGLITVPIEFIGGDGGFDTLEIRGGESLETTYTAFGPDSGTVQVGDTFVTYSGLEPIVDTSNAANIVITGTAGDDILILEENPGNPAQLRIRALNGSLESVAFNHPTSSLTINLGAGNDTITIQTFDSVLGASLTINGQAGTDTITVPTAGLVSTRAIGGVNYATDPSTGNSGSMTWNAETITVAASGSVFAQATGGFTAGNIQLQAVATQSVVGNVATLVQLTGAIVRAGNVTFTANSTLNPPTVVQNTLAQFNQNSSAQVVIDGASRITTSGTLSLTAFSTVVAGVTANSVAGSNIDAALALGTLASTARVKISGSTSVASGGALSLTATNDTTFNTTGNATVGGATTIGAAGALADVDTTTEAYIDGTATVTQAASITLTANFDGDVNSTALAAAQGATAISSNLANLLASNAAATQAGNVSVAAAVAYADVLNRTRAYIGSTGAITSAGAINVSAPNSLRVPTVADGTSVNNPVGVGVGVAINAVDSLNEAYLTGAVNLTAPSVTLGVSQFGGIASAFSTTATAGAGATNVGVAGAVSINRSTNKSEATIKPASAVTLAANTDLTLSAASHATSTALAAPEGILGGNVGIGGSVAMNFATQSARAEVQGTASLAGVRNLSLTTNGNFTATTTAQAGAAGGTAVAASVALGLPTHQSIAGVLVGPAAALTGTLTIQSTHLSNVTTTAKADTAGVNVVVGPALALGVDTETASASVARSLTSTGAATLNATSTTDSTTTAIAGARGANPIGSNANQLINNQLNFANPGGGVVVPAAQTADGTVGVPAAVAVNHVNGDALASVLAGGSLQSGAALLVQASGDNDAIAQADSRAVNSGTGVGVAVAINFPDFIVEASTSGAVSGVGVTIQSQMVSGQTNQFTAEAISGAGVTNVGVAAALALNIPTLHNEALVRTGGSVNAGGGSVLVSATSVNSTLANAVPAGTGVISGGLGVGATAAFNFPDLTTRAEVEATTSLTNLLNLTV